MRQSPTHQPIVRSTDSPADEGVPVAWRILQLLAIIAGAATVALGLAVMVAWHLDNARLVQLAPTLAPMYYNEALSFVLCGTGLLGLTIRRRRVAAVCGTIAGTLGFLTLLEYLLSVSLGIDQLLIKSSIAVQTSDPGR